MTSPRCIIAAITAASALAVSALVAAPVASAEPAQTRLVVDRWYVDFLARDADPGSQYWIDSIESGNKAGDQLWRITHSEEYDAANIETYYRTLLGRAPDPGARYWIDGVNAQRFPLEWALQNILASPEYVGNRGSRATADAYVDAVLGRGAGSGEIDYWQARVEVAGPLGAVRELYYTPEAVRQRVGDAFVSLLNRRGPTPAEVTYWSAKEIENSVNVRVLIASTPEYRDLQIARSEFHM